MQERKIIALLRERDEQGLHALLVHDGPLCDTSSLPFCGTLRSGRWRDGYTGGNGSCGNCREVMSVPKEDWGFLNEKAFEAALQASVPERLPDKAAAVTPRKRAIGRVLAGTALTALGTNLWGLNYLLPGIGLVLMLLGFRLLRREEIEACRGAIQVVVSVQEFDQEGGFCRSSGSNPLCITGVGGS